MSVFSDMAAGARAAHSHFFGDSVTLDETGSSPRSVKAVLGTVRVETRNDNGREHRVSVRSCRFVTLTSVRHDAKILISGATWTIDDFLDRQASHLTVSLKRVVASEVARTGYRGRG